VGRPIWRTYDGGRWIADRFDLYPFFFLKLKPSGTFSGSSSSERQSRPSQRGWGAQRPWNPSCLCDPGAAGDVGVAALATPERAAGASTAAAAAASLVHPQPPTHLPIAAARASSPTSRVVQNGGCCRIELRPIWNLSLGPRPAGHTPSA